MHEQIMPLRCGHTICYLVQGPTGSLLIDTGFAESLGQLGSQLKMHALDLQIVDYLLVTHFHPDHMGIARDLVELGVTLLLPSCQVPFVHQPDHMYARDRNRAFRSIREEDVCRLEPEDSRKFLSAHCGIDGQVVQTPGHSPDSISLVLDSGDAFVGDLCPFDQVELYGDVQMESSWEKLLGLGVHLVHFAHWPDERI